MFLAVLWSLMKLTKGLCTRIFYSALLRILQDSGLILNCWSQVQRLTHKNFQISLIKHLYLEYQVREIFLHVMYLTYPNTRLWDLRLPQQCCWRFQVFRNETSSQCYQGYAMKSSHSASCSFTVPACPSVCMQQQQQQEIWCDFDCASSLICGNKMPTRCNRGFLLQILLLAQHVSGITMPIIRGSRVLYSGCCLWYFVLWFFK